jgi:hypothetical protein
MGKQQPGVFDKQAFIAAVKKAIDAAAPKNLEEADDFKGSGKAGKAKDEIHAQVKGGKQESEKNIKQATDAAPDQSKAKPRTVTPMVNDEPGVPPGDVGAAAAMPSPRPPQQTDLSGGPAEIDAKMAEADVTEEQIKKSNEPEFNAALEAREGARKQSAAAPAEYRAKEQDVLAKGRGEAEATAGAELQGMHGARAQALAKVVGKKGETKSADEEKRAKVATDIQGIYDRTKADVTKTLDGLDGKVDAAFTKGEGAARSEFESDVDKRMSDYKDKRYGGFWGKGRWIKDKLAGMPDEVNKFYEDGKRSYLAAMDGVIGEIADIVGTELTAARTRIAQGRGEVQKYVAQLPADLREVGKEAEGKLESQFEQLSSDVDAKQDAMVDKLATKYVEARDKLDARIDELKAANKGLVDKALDAVVGVVKTILKLKDMLMGVLSRAAGAIGDILKDPIGFLGNLVAGVKGGLMRFVDNIAGHLQEGLMGWLFGALGGAGLTLPKALDFAGILDLVTQVLGLTYQNVRARLAKVVGEPLVAKMERTVDVIRDFATKGIAGAWEWIKDKIGDLEEMVLGEIKEWVIFKVIKAGVLWIVSLLNPASAFVKACKAIYDIVMFIVERGSEIMAFVNSVLDSIASIAKGSLGGVAEKVEGALAKALPLAISFLAGLLGLGGISDKIRGVIDKVRSPINKAIDTVVGGAVKMFKKMFGPALKWAKKKFEKGKAFVKGKVEAGKKWVKGKVDAGKKWVKDKDKDKKPPDERTLGEQQAAVRAAAAEVESVRAAAPPQTAKQAVTSKMAQVKATYRLNSIGFMPAGDGKERVVAEINPKAYSGTFDAEGDVDYARMRDAKNKAIDAFLGCTEPARNEKRFADDQVRAAGKATDLPYRDAAIAHQERASLLWNRVTKLEGDLDKAGEWYERHDHSLGAKVFEELENRALSIVTDVAALTADRPVGDWDLDFVDLTDGRLLLKPSYRGKKTRSSFYPHDYSPDTKDRMIKTIANFRADYDGTVYWEYLGRTSPRGDFWWALNDKLERPTLDHTQPTVLSHWNASGRTTTYPDRRRFYDFEGASLVVVPHTLNSSAGGSEPDSYTPEVTRAFRGAKK